MSFNYRYGALGFLSLKDPSLGVPGNTAFKDQAFALKWVQRNIANFGGDKNNVTLFGESAGGASVNYHMISQHSKGLFKRAIPMSGVALSSWAFQPVRNYAQRLASLLEYDGEQSERSILTFLESVDIRKILALSFKIFTEKVDKFDKISSRSQLSNLLSGITKGETLFLGTVYRAICDRKLFHTKTPKGDGTNSLVE